LYYNNTNAGDHNAIENIEQYCLALVKPLGLNT
jgi:hypothetical protein